MTPTQDALKQTVDYTLGSVAVSAPWWLTVFEVATTIILALGGLVLLAIRLAISWREWKNHKK